MLSHKNTDIENSIQINSSGKIDKLIIEPNRADTIVDIVDSHDGPAEQTMNGIKLTSKDKTNVKVENQSELDISIDEEKSNVLETIPTKFVSGNTESATNIQQITFYYDNRVSNIQSWIDLVKKSGDNLICLDKEHNTPILHNSTAVFVGKLDGHDVFFRAQFKYFIDDVNPHTYISLDAKSSSSSINLGQWINDIKGSLNSIIIDGSSTSTLAVGDEYKFILYDATNVYPIKAKFITTSSTNSLTLPEDPIVYSTIVDRSSISNLANFNGSITYADWFDDILSPADYRYVVLKLFDASGNETTYSETENITDSYTIDYVYLKNDNTLQKFVRAKFSNHTSNEAPDNTQDITSVEIETISASAVQFDSWLSDVLPAGYSYATSQNSDTLNTTDDFYVFVYKTGSDIMDNTYLLKINFTSVGGNSLVNFSSTSSIASQLLKPTYEKEDFASWFGTPPNVNVHINGYTTVFNDTPSGNISDYYLNDDVPTLVPGSSGALSEAHAFFYNSNGVYFANLKFVNNNFVKFNNIYLDFSDIKYGAKWNEITSEFFKQLTIRSNITISGPSTKHIAVDVSNNNVYKKQSVGTENINFDSVGFPLKNVYVKIASPLLISYTMNSIPTNAKWSDIISEIDAITKTKLSGVDVTLASNNNLYVKNEDYTYGTHGVSLKFTDDFNYDIDVKQKLAAATSTKFSVEFKYSTTPQITHRTVDDTIIVSLPSGELLNADLENYLSGFDGLTADYVGAKSHYDGDNASYYFSLKTNVLKTQLDCFATSTDSVPKKLTILETTATFKAGCTIGDWMYDVLDGSNGDVLVPMTCGRDDIIATNNKVLFVGRRSEKTFFRCVLFSTFFGATNTLSPHTQDDKMYVVASHLVYGEKWSSEHVVEQLKKLMMNSVGLGIVGDVNKGRNQEHVLLDITDNMVFKVQSGNCLYFENAMDKYEFPADKIYIKMTRPLVLNYHIQNLSTNVKWIDIEDKIYSAYRNSVLVSDWDSFSMKITQNGNLYVKDETFSNATNGLQIQFRKNSDVVNQKNGVINQYKSDSGYNKQFYMTFKIDVAEGSYSYEDDCHDVIRVMLPGGYMNVEDVVGYLNYIFDDLDLKGGADYMDAYIPHCVNGKNPYNIDEDNKEVVFMLQELFITSRYLCTAKDVRYYDMKRMSSISRDFMSKLMRYVAFVGYVFGTEFYNRNDLDKLMNGRKVFKNSTFTYFVRKGDPSVRKQIFEKSIPIYYNKYLLSHEPYPQQYFDGLYDLNTRLFDDDEGECSTQVITNVIKNLIDNSMKLSYQNQDHSILSPSHPLNCFINNLYKNAAFADLMGTDCSARRESADNYLSEAAWSGMEALVSADSATDKWYGFIRSKSRNGDLSGPKITSILLGAFTKAAPNASINDLEIYHKYVNLFIQGRKDSVKSQVVDKKRVNKRGGIFY